jgi:hydroxyacylglutathione hydrolase
MAQMWASLEKLNALPDGTKIYCAHEYTSANAAFAVTIDPDNEELRARVAEIAALRADNKPTVPTEIALERATNPFLRATNAAIQAHLGMSGAAAVDVFAEIRARKDNF